MDGRTDMATVVVLAAGATHTIHNERIRRLFFLFVLIASGTQGERIFSFLSLFE